MKNLLLWVMMACLSTVLALSACQMEEVKEMASSEGADGSIPNLNLSVEEAQALNEFVDSYMDFVLFVESNYVVFSEFAASNPNPTEEQASSFFLNDLGAEDILIDISAASGNLESIITDEDRMQQGIELVLSDRMENGGYLAAKKGDCSGWSIVGNLGVAAAMFVGTCTFSAGWGCGLGAFAAGERIRDTIIYACENCARDGCDFLD